MIASRFGRTDPHAARSIGSSMGASLSCNDRRVLAATIGSSDGLTLVSIHVAWPSAILREDDAGPLGVPAIVPDHFRDGRDLFAETGRPGTRNALRPFVVVDPHERTRALHRHAEYGKRLLRHVLLHHRQIGSLRLIAERGGAGEQQLVVEGARGMQSERGGGGKEECNHGLSFVQSDTGIAAS
ncbi:hypothetical protein WJT74_12000 [Sphingomicrobium sp. XHP0239]|uniref:hypothetical protein n=1 Tax=Sphingomicrobium maritimum TaxID=3133972 RepID=UPI0031CC6D80